jgi:hypothetical protein
MKSDALREADIYYLEHESFAFVTPTGRTWNVYGSPVRQVTVEMESSSQAMHLLSPGHSKICSRSLPVFFV